MPLRPWALVLLLASFASCGERAQQQTSAAPVDPCALDGVDVVDSELRAALERCTGVVPSPLDRVERVPLEGGTLVEVEVAREATPGDPPPADLIVAWLTPAPPRIEAWAVTNQKEGTLVSARAETLGGERVLVERVSTSSVPFITYADEVVWLLRAPKLVRAGSYAIERNGGFGNMHSWPIESTYAGTSTFSGKQIIVDEKVVWHFPDVASSSYPDSWARPATYRRSYTLSDGVLQADPAPPRVPPQAPTVSPR